MSKIKSYLIKFIPDNLKYKLKKMVYKRRLKNLTPIVIKKDDNMLNKRVIYTCITGDYDDLINHNCINLNWDYICFTNNEELLNKKKVGMWTIRPLMFNKLDNQRNSRWHKLFPHKLFPNYNYSIWIDASINVLDNFLFERSEDLIRNKKVISQPIHSVRDCIYEEATEVIRANLDNKDIVQRQIELIEKDNYPENRGLKENTFIFRIHHNPLCIKIMEQWWWWLTHYSRRDQLSFNYVAWKNNFDSEPFSKDRWILRKSNHFMCMSGKRKGREVKVQNSPKKHI